MEEIQKFPYPVQRLIGDEALAVTSRLRKGKAPPGLMTAECYCSFFTTYLVPCRHIFHEDMYGSTKLLTAEVWDTFQQLFAENGFEIYQSRELVEVLPPHQEEQRETEARHLAFNEMLERLRDQYWRVEEAGDADQAVGFINQLETAINPVLNNVAQHE